MSRSPDQRVIELAADQHGVVTRRQLLGAGLTSRQIQRRSAAGRLRRVHRGVYILGQLHEGLEPARAAEMAAVLASGPGALVGHLHAAALWDLTPEPGRSEPVHVVLPAGRSPTRSPGIIAHRAGDLEPADAAEVDGIPVTSPLRTLSDLAGRTTLGELERAVARAERAGLVEAEDLRDLAARRRGRVGAPLLRAVIGQQRGAALTRSEAESRFLELIRGTGLPQPRVNHVFEGYELDFYWPGARVAVEVDGFAYHRSRQSFRSDRRRDARLFGVAGISVLRFTWEQIVDEPKETLITLVRALDRASSSGPPTG